MDEWFNELLTPAERAAKRPLQQETNTMKHTAGKWKADIRSGAVAVYPADEHYQCFSGVSRGFVHYKEGHRVEVNGRLVSWEMDEEDVANARLIAAAPDMYEALWAIMDSVEAQKVRLDIYELELAQAALSKVEGE